MNDHDSAEMRRPSTYLISFGLALMWSSARWLADAEQGAHRVAGYYLALGLAVFGSMLALLSCLYGLLLALWLLPAVLTKWRSLRPPAPPKAETPGPVIYQRQVGGVVGTKPRVILMDEERPARWAAWNDTALEVLLWYRVTGSLIYSVMVGPGKAFKKNQDAQEVFTEMDRLGLVVLQNGRATVLADSLPSVLAAIRSCKLDWDDAHDPPAISPAPLRERLAAPVVIQTQS